MGKNAFKDVEKANPSLEASKAIEKRKFDKAIGICLNALGSTSREFLNAAPAASDIRLYFFSLVQEKKDADVLTSLLSIAIAKKYGIDLLQIAIHMATQDSDSQEANEDAGGNEITLLFPILPDATDANIYQLDVALSLLQTIPETLKTTADRFKETILLTASFALRTKTLDKDGDGKISTLEALDLSPENAATILAQILSASQVAEAIANSVGGESIDEEKKQEAVAQINEVYGEIANQPGETDDEKLRNFLAAQGGDTTAE